LGILITVGISGCKEDERPIVGAIRWDAWTGGGITNQVEHTLGPEKYHDRLPWFAKVIDTETVTIDGSSQDVINKEINFAATAGIDYWAFLLYPEASSMSTALKQYLSSPMRGKISFCLILSNNLKVSNEQWPIERERAIKLLMEREYICVAGGRPLLYAYGGKDFPFTRFNEILVALRKKGLRPYCVYMGTNPQSDFEKVKDKGFDAVSAYAKGGRQRSYAALSKSVEMDYWHNAVTYKVPYIPLVTTGWEKSPRKDNPVSWEMESSYHSQMVFPSKAEPVEIAQHLKRALVFLRQHRNICPANAVIIYAWNEYDEGGWIAPTLGADARPDMSRLDAIKKILRP
jgi:hypothetical protein